jgi:uncharacterized circularly permuted ATP-grasp superfamily protein
MASELDPPFDEAWARAGVPRPHYQAVMDAVNEIGADALSATVAQALTEGEVTFGEARFVVDPIPRLITAVEWRCLEMGLCQRARALNRFLSDVYGAQEIVAAGVVPQAALDSAEGFERDLRGTVPHQPWPAAIIGFDVVRAPDGEFLVLEDNLRTPSGFAYALAARTAVLAALGEALPSPRSLEPALWELLGAALRATAPGRPADPLVVVLTDGPDNVAYWEHALAADALAAVLATPDDLVRDGSRLRVARPDGSTSAVDVIYRRTNEDRARDEQGELTPVAAKLLEPWLAGSIGLVNAFGNGVADDKLVHSHVEQFVQFYLDEAPLIRSVPTTSVESDPDQVADRLSELVVKPRHGHGGIGVVIGRHSDEGELQGLTRELRKDPSGYIAQPTITLSVHPTVIEGGLAPRHVDLRAFSFAAEDIALMPGGLSRVALEEGALVVNSSQDGGGKDTWIMPADVS